jgi:hypothetical protein
VGALVVAAGVVIAVIPVRGFARTPASPRHPQADPVNEAEALK